jgi:hypothetical protein
MLEEHLYQVMEACAEQGNPSRANPLVVQGVDHLSKVLASAVKSIDNQVNGSDRMSEREVWLLRRMFESDGDAKAHSGKG